MIKTFLLTITTFFLISCASFEPRLVEDKFYPDNTYFTTGDTVLNYYYLYPEDFGSINPIGISFKTLHGKPDLIMRIYYNAPRLFIINENEKVIIKYKNGSTTTLDYTERVPRYYRDNYNIFAISNIILDYKEIDMIRVEVDGYYSNIEVTDKNNKELRKIFNDMQVAVNNYYSKN